MALKITGTGSSLPAKILTNDDISKMVDTNDEWIRERTGIGNRHIIEEETAHQMAADACLKALTKAEVAAEDIDIILLATCSATPSVPCVACRVQSHIGATNAVALDINAACSGFLFAMNIASAYMESGIYKKALVVGVETLSRIVDYTDRGTCILFGDGAGAACVEADSSEDSFYKYIQRADGTKGDVLSVEKYIQMDGREVFKFATRKVPECIGELLDKEGISADDVDMYILHQANKRIIEAAANRLKQDISKFPMNVELVGNTSSASIPILLAELEESGKLKRGMLIVMSGFGAGLTYGACIMRW